MILLIEDSASIVRILKAQITAQIPGVTVSCVADGENAYKALTGQKYYEFQPSTNSVIERVATVFLAAIWDNHLPEKWGEEAQPDVGLRTIKALRDSGNISSDLLSHFISHSGDESPKFRETDYFARIYPKSMTIPQIRELGKLFAEWKVATPELVRRRGSPVSAPELARRAPRVSNSTPELARRGGVRIPGSLSLRIPGQGSEISTSIGSSNQGSLTPTKSDDLNEQEDDLPQDADLRETLEEMSLQERKVKTPLVPIVRGKK